jgi:PhnB protein
MSSTAPEGYTDIAPWVVTDDTGAFLDFVTAAFGGQELARVAVEDGSIGHGEIRVGNTVVLAFDRRPEWPVMPSLLRVFVADAGAAMAAAVAAGARVITPAADSAWGDRGGRVRDPFGNIWWVVSRREQVAPEEAWQRLGQPVYADAMRDAQETLDAELSGRATGRPSAPIAPEIATRTSAYRRATRCGSRCSVPDPRPPATSPRWPPSAHSTSWCHCATS